MKHPEIQRLPQGTALIFDTADDLLEAMFGPAQQDAHVIARNRAVWLAEKTAEYDVRAQAVRDGADQMIARLHSQRAANLAAAQEGA